MIKIPILLLLIFVASGCSQSNEEKLVTLEKQADLLVSAMNSSRKHTEGDNDLFAINRTNYDEFLGLSVSMIPALEEYCTQFKTITTLPEKKYDELLKKHSLFFNKKAPIISLGIIMIPSLAEIGNSRLNDHIKHTKHKTKGTKTTGDYLELLEERSEKVSKILSNYTSPPISECELR